MTPKEKLEEIENAKKKKLKHIKLKNKRIWGVQCPECKKRMFSFYVHDYKKCGCPNDTTVDGGRYYLIYGWLDKRPKRIYWTQKQDGIYPINTINCTKEKIGWKIK